jgi:hypothetical protein
MNPFPLHEQHSRKKSSFAMRFQQTFTVPIIISREDIIADVMYGAIEYSF